MKALVLSSFSILFLLLVACTTTSETKPSTDPAATVTKPTVATPAAKPPVAVPSIPMTQPSVTYKPGPQSRRPVPENTLTIGMQESDLQQVSQALERSPSGQARRWSSQDAKTNYEVTPKQQVTKQGKPCREFDLVITNPNNQRQSGQFTACRLPDGTWVNLA